MPTKRITKKVIKKLYIASAIVGLALVFITSLVIANKVGKPKHLSSSAGAMYKSNAIWVDNKLLPAYQTPGGLVAYQMVGNSVVGRTQSRELWQSTDFTEGNMAGISGGLDTDKDSYPEVIVAQTGLGPNQPCGSILVDQSQLSVVSGKTGKLLYRYKTANCATTNGSPFQYKQLFVGSLLFGSGVDAFAVRQYEDNGKAVRFSSGVGEVIGTGALPYGHAANGLVLPFATTNKVSLFTTGRFMQYRLDKVASQILSSINDTQFVSHKSTTDDYNDQGAGECFDGCRNYGLVTAFSVAGQNKIALISGTSTDTLADDARSGSQSTDVWGGISRHVDIVNPDSGALETSRYYSYAHDPNNTDQHKYAGRVTYPAHPVITVGSDTYIVFNVYNQVDGRSDSSVDDRWYVSVNKVESNGSLSEQKIYNTYIWDIIEDTSGNSVLVGTETVGYWPKKTNGTYQTLTGRLGGSGNSIDWQTSTKGLPKTAHMFRSPNISTSHGVLISVLVTDRGVETDSGEASVPIIPSPTPTPVPPTLSIYASPSTISSGQSTIIYWECANTTAQCTITKNGAVMWTGSAGKSAFSSLPLNQTTTYAISTAGHSTSTTVTVTGSQSVPTPTPTPTPTSVPPTLSIYASPSTISAGQSTVVYWECKNAVSCTILKNGVVMWTGSSGQSAFNTLPLNTTTSYTIKATDTSGTVHTTAPAVVQVTN